MNDKFLESIMDNRRCKILTICGSAKFRELKEKYQAYYTVKNNLVFAPVNYLAIKDEVETTEEIENINSIFLAHIHDKKITLSEAIIVVTNEEGYFGLHTAREIEFAYKNNKKILFTHVKEKDRDKYYFNNDQIYPLYILKEE